MAIWISYLCPFASLSLWVLSIFFTFAEYMFCVFLEYNLPFYFFTVSLPLNFNVIYIYWCICTLTWMSTCAYRHRLLKLRGQLARVSSFLQYTGPMGRNQVTKLVSDIQVPVLLWNINSDSMPKGWVRLWPLWVKSFVADTIEKF